VQGALRLALVVSALLAGGCSVVDLEDPAETERSLKVAHAGGLTRVPAQADRVVALAQDALETSLALGVKPVGVYSPPPGGYPAYLGRRAGGIEPMGPLPRPDPNFVEYVAPDLILARRDLQRRSYRRLSAIASTIMTADAGHSWEVNTRLHGEALGRIERVEALLRAYDRRAARVRRMLDRLGDVEVSVVRVTRTRVVAAGGRSFAGTVLGDAGLGRPRRQRAERAVISASARPDALAGDFILLSVAAGAGPRLRALERSPLWRGLDAVERGRVHHVADNPWGTGGGVLGAEAALGDLERLLEGAQAG